MTLVFESWWFGAWALGLGAWEPGISLVVWGGKLIGVLFGVWGAFFAQIPYQSDRLWCDVGGRVKMKAKRRVGLAGV